MRPSTQEEWEQRTLHPDSTSMTWGAWFRCVVIVAWIIMAIICGSEASTYVNASNASNNSSVAEVNKFWRIFAGTQLPDSTAPSRAALGMVAAIGDFYVTDGRQYLRALVDKPNAPLMGVDLQASNLADAPFADFERDTGFSIVDTSFTNPRIADKFTTQLKLYQEYGLNRVFAHSHKVALMWPLSWLLSWAWLILWLGIGHLAFLVAMMLTLSCNPLALPSRDRGAHRWVWFFAPIAMAIALVYCAREEIGPAIQQRRQTHRRRIEARGQRQRLEMMRDEHPDSFHDAQWARNQIALLRALPNQTQEVHETIAKLQRVVDLVSNVVPEEMSAAEGTQLAQTIGSQADTILTSLETKLRVSRGDSLCPQPANGGFNI